MPRHSILLIALLAVLAVQCFAFNLRVDEQAKAQLQQILNGYWEQGGLNDPTTVIDCFVDDSPKLTMDFFNKLADALANSQYLEVPAIVLNYKKGLPDSVNPCVMNNTEVKQVADAYNVSGLSMTDFFRKMESYVIGHVSEVHQDFVNINNELKAEEFNTVGKDAGTLLQNVMKNGNNLDLLVNSF